MVHAFLDVERPFAFAHRGGDEVAAENTVAAFDHAVGLGFRYLETDVHLTGDGVLVAFHDPELDRVAHADGTIADHTWDELSQIDLGDGGRIPRMDELFATFPDVYWNIDPKADESVDPLSRLILAHDAIDQVCIGSFSDDRIAQMSEHLGPRLCTSAGPKHVALLFGAFVGGRAVSKLRNNALVESVARQHGCLQIPPKIKGIGLVDARSVETAHELGLQVHVWTIDDPDEMHRLFDLGVDALMTDKPSVLKGVMMQRGVWS